MTERPATSGGKTWPRTRCAAALVAISSSPRISPAARRCARSSSSTWIPASRSAPPSRRRPGGGMEQPKVSAWGADAMRTFKAGAPKIRSSTRRRARRVSHERTRIERRTARPMAPRCDRDRARCEPVGRRSRGRRLHRLPLRAQPPRARRALLQRGCRGSDGVTTVGWLLLVLPAVALGVPPEWWSPLVGAAAFAACAAVTARAAARLAGSTVPGSPPD